MIPFRKYICFHYIPSRGIKKGRNFSVLFALPLPDRADRNLSPPTPARNQAYLLNAKNSPPKKLIDWIDVLFQP
jgi:hypothetical protein